MNKIVNVRPNTLSQLVTLHTYMQTFRKTNKYSPSIMEIVEAGHSTDSFTTRYYLRVMEELKMIEVFKSPKGKRIPRGYSPLPLHRADMKIKDFLSTQLEGVDV